MRRRPNVDDNIVFGRILEALEVIQKDMPIIFPIHPRTRKQLRHGHLKEQIRKMSHLRLTKPMGYLDFLKLVSSAKIVLTDSGGIQEETTVLGIPCLTLRENTERPITAEVGTNQIVGTDPARIIKGYRKAVNGWCNKLRTPPLWDGHAAERIVKILLEKI